MSELRNHQAAPTKERGGPVRVPDSKGFFGPTQPSGGTRPPRDKIAVGSSSSAAQQTQK